MGDDVVIESLDICRRIASEFSGVGTELGGGKSHVEPFIRLWTGRVESAYYELLSAHDESQARMRLAGLCEALAEVEDLLWQRRLEGR